MLGSTAGEEEAGDGLGWIGRLPHEQSANGHDIQQGDAEIFAAHFDGPESGRWIPGAPESNELFDFWAVGAGADDEHVQRSVPNLIIDGSIVLEEQLNCIRRNSQIRLPCDRG